MYCMSYHDVAYRNVNRRSSIYSRFGHIALSNPIWIAFLFHSSAVSPKRKPPRLGIALLARGRRGEEDKMSDEEKKEEVVKSLAEMEEESSAATGSETADAAGKGGDVVAASLASAVAKLPVIEAEGSTAGACEKADAVGVAADASKGDKP
jgi:hypothetical protein